MKILKEHYEHMKVAINRIPENEYHRHKRCIIAAGEYKNSPEKVMRWKCARVVGLMDFITDTLYQYMNDDHVDTALRNIMKENGFEN